MMLGYYRQSYRALYVIKTVKLQQQSDIHGFILSTLSTFWNDVYASI